MRRTRREGGRVLTIRHEPAARRFAVDVAGATAFISYRELAGSVLDLHHTYVPPAARGGGIASQLTAHALRHARDGGYKVVPSCPFVAAYLARHSEYHDLRS
jgi:predicted GNAT family acetyltransferase